MRRRFVAACLSALASTALCVGAQPALATPAHVPGIQPTVDSATSTPVSTASTSMGATHGTDADRTVSKNLMTGARRLSADDRAARHGRAPAKEIAGYSGSGDPADVGTTTDGSRMPENVRPAPSPVFTTTTVFGEDGRRRVANNQAYPERTNVLILANAPDGNTYQCTGFLYGPDIVATAGHCVFSNQFGGWIESATIYPAIDGAGDFPYGSCYGTLVHSVKGWTEYDDITYDYGAIQLSCTVGNTTGWIGLHWQSASHNGEKVAIVGYPVDAAVEYSMMGMYGFIRESTTRQLGYKIDTSGGQSGAAVYQPGCSGTYCAIAVHAYGGVTYNIGTRINQEVFDNYHGWRYPD